jgi:Flp pilus assembly protein TadD
LDRKDAAITEFREALDIAPENALAASNLCGVYVHFGLLSEAEEMCEFSLELGPNYMALSNLGSLAFRRSNFGEAVSWFEEALQLDASDYLLWGNLGFAYHHMDRDDEAREKLLRAVEMAERELAARPSDPWLPVDLGGYLAVLGSRDRALELLDAAAADPRDDPSWTLALGEAYEDAGAREEALRWVARALDDGLRPSQILNSPALRKVEAFRTLAEGYEPGP